MGTRGKASKPLPLPSHSPHTWSQMPCPFQSPWSLFRIPLYSYSRLLPAIPLQSVSSHTKNLASVNSYLYYFSYCENLSMQIEAFPGGASGKEPTCQCRRHKRFRFDPWIQKIPWRRKWQPTPLFLPGECQVLRSLAGYSPWGLKVLNTSEAI